MGKTERGRRKEKKDGEERGEEEDREEKRGRGMREREKRGREGQERGHKHGEKSVNKIVENTSCQQNTFSLYV